MKKNNNTKSSGGNDHGKGRTHDVAVLALVATVKVRPALTAVVIGLNVSARGNLTKEHLNYKLTWKGRKQQKGE